MKTRAFENGEEMAVAYGLAPNAAPVEAGGDGWYLIAPFGEWPLPGTNLIQVFGREQAEAMVAVYNSVPFKINRWFGNDQVPVLIEHPDVDPNRYHDRRMLAPRHLALEVREDGLWGQAAWNALGRENLAEGYWRYPSPVWLYKKPPPGERRIYPDMLQSVGLTNFPAAPDARRVSANAAWADEEGRPTEDAEGTERGAGAPGAGDENSNQTTTTMNELTAEDVAAILAALELEEGSGRDEILAKIESLRGMQAAATEDGDAAMQGANADVAPGDEGRPTEGAEGAEGAAASDDEVAANAALDSAVAEALAVRTAAANAVVTLAVEAGRVTGADVEAVTAGLVEAEDFAAACNAVLSRPVDGLHKKGLDLNRETTLLDSPEHRKAAANAAVATIAQERGLDVKKDFSTLWAAAKGDPRFSRIWDAMERKG